MTIAEKLLRAKTDYDEVADASYIRGESDGYASGVAAQPVPTITVGADGLITASAGEKSATKQLSTQAAKTITPTHYGIQAVAAGKYTTGNVSVKGDTNLIASNIKSGVSIFGVTGTYDNYDEGRKEGIPYEVQAGASSKWMGNYTENLSTAYEPSIYFGTKKYYATDPGFAYQLWDWLECATEGEDSTPFIVTFRNKHRKFHFRLFVRVTCYDDIGDEARDGIFYKVYDIPPDSSKSFDFDCQGWVDGGYWEYEIEGVRVYA